LLREYYILAKPGIVYGNALSGIAGFMLAARGTIDVLLLLAAIGGMSLIIGGSCVLNNYLDRHIDAKMARTQKRALVSGTIPVCYAIIYGFVLIGLGFSIIAVFVNWLTVLVGFIGLVDYVVLYGITKRRTVHSTLIGSVSGSMPIVAGYVAVTGRFDLVALVLFLILTCWQMPHFYAIAIYRMKDYQAASLPMLPIVKGVKRTKINMVVYIVAFEAAVIALWVVGHVGIAYLFVTASAGLAWLWRSLAGFNASNDVAWARQLFVDSLWVLMITCVMIAVGPLLP
jgi:protoheme IX farnesyltransferase